MDSDIQQILEVLDDHKQSMCDGEYKKAMDALMSLNDKENKKIIETIELLQVINSQKKCILNTKRLSFIQTIVWVVNIITFLKLLFS